MSDMWSNARIKSAREEGSDWVNCWGSPAMNL